MKKNIILFTLAFAMLSIQSCKKPAGEGGQATINGKLYIQNYNSTFTTINDEYYAQGEQVYIIYGNETGVGNNVRTSYDGSFEFKYLRPGNYKVYALSKDIKSPSASKTIEVLKEVTISKKKEVVTLPDIVIIK